MGFILPGFPESQENKIDMPDIGELLCYPMFNDAEIEAVYKHGTEFQKFLLDKVPLQNDKKHINVLSVVHLMRQNSRPVTAFGSGKRIDEWHIDGAHMNEYDYQKPNDRVHLMLSHCKATTEFISSKLDFSFIPDDMSRTDFMEIFTRYALNNHYDYKAIETNRIYTFRNHIHRPGEVDRVELRYTLRVRETDSINNPKYDTEGIIKNVMFYESGGIQKRNMEIGQGEVKIFIPKSSYFRKS